MQKSTLFRLLNSLTEAEFSDLGKYVRSPIYNNSGRCIELLALIEKEYPNLESFRLHKEVVLKKLFPSKKYDNTGLRNLMSQLKNLVEGFLIFVEENTPENAVYRQHLLLQAFLKKNLSKDFERIYHKTEQHFKKKKLGDLADDYERFLLLTDAHKFKVSFPKSKIALSIQEVVQALDSHYLQHKLKYASLARQRNQLIPTELLPTEAILKSMKSAVHLPDSILIYQAILKLYDNTEPTEFGILKKILFTETEALPKTDLLNIFAFAINFCIRQWQQGHAHYLDDTLELYEKMLTQKLLHNGQYIPLGHFKNIVILGVRGHKMDWTAEFIERYTPELPPKYRSAMHDFALGLCFFYKKEYHTALQYLLQSEMQEDLYPIDQRTLLFKIYYELNEVLALYDFVPTFQKFLKTTSKMPKGYDRKAYLQFLRFGKKLFKIKQVKRRDRQKLEGVKASIQTASPLADKAWLLEKLAVLY